jgi:hypothetical protein
MKLNFFRNKMLFFGLLISALTYYTGINANTCQWSGCTPYILGGNILGGMFGQDKPLLDDYAKRYNLSSLNLLNIENAFFQCKKWKGQWPANCYVDENKTLTSEKLLQKFNSNGFQPICDKGRTCYDILFSAPVEYRYSVPVGQGGIPIIEMNQKRATGAQAAQSADQNWEKKVTSVYNAQPGQQYKTAAGNPLSIYGSQYNR